MSTATLIPMEPVKSDRIAELGYAEDLFILSVRFHPTKAAPAGKIYHYQNVSEELFYDLKTADSIGSFFGARIVKRADLYPFTCIDEGSAVAKDTTGAPATVAEVLPPVIPDDEEGLKTLAMSTRAEVTSLTITTAEECEVASREVLRIRAERKLAIEKVNKIKIPATQAWQAACALFNEIDSRYAEAEKYLDGGILAYRAKERQRAAEEAAVLARQQEENRLAALKQQQEEFQRQQAAAEEEARQKAAELAKSDAAIAEAQGAPAEVVQQIIENPLPVAVRHVAPPPLAFAAAPASPIVQQNIPKVQGLSFTTEWLYEVTDEASIPLTHEFYTLDLKKVNAKVQSLKQHANIPGVRVYSEERPIKRTGKK